VKNAAKSLSMFLSCSKRSRNYPTRLRRNLTFSASAMLRAASDLKTSGRPERVVQAETQGAERQVI
jgi:hypothetical protein